VASAIWPFGEFVRPRENISLASHTTECRMPRKRPSPAANLRLQHARDAVAEAQIGMPDDAGAQPALAVASARAHRRRAIDEFDFADRLHLARAIGAVHRTTFDKDAVRDVVAAAGVGQQLVEQIAVLVAIPQMMVRIHDVEPRLQDLLLPLRPPRRIAVARRAEHYPGRPRRHLFASSPGSSEEQCHPALPPYRPASCDVTPNAGQPSSQSSPVLPALLFRTSRGGNRSRPLYRSSE
jgi:hypothetical protein